MRQFIMVHDLMLPVWVLLGIFAMFGLIALVAPGVFASLTRQSNRWVDTAKLLSTLDKRYDVDQFVLPYSRMLGAAVLVGVALLACVLGGYFG